MATYTTAQEYDLVRTAIQTLSTTGQAVASFNIGNMQVTFAASQLQWLQAREKELAKRLTQKNTRKRVTPDFSGGDGSYLNL